MLKNKIDKKYYPAIWTALILASVFRFAYQLINGYTSMTDTSAASIMLNVLIDLLFNALLPAWLCYCCASIFWAMAWRRGYRFITRNDFIYLTMIFTAAARAVMGLVEVFALLDGAVYAYTSVLLDVTVLSAALYTMYFTVLTKKYMNPVESYEVFNIYASIYLIFQGLHTAVPCLVYVAIADGTAFYETFGEALEQAGYNFTTADPNFVTASFIALGVLGAYIVVTVVMSLILRKKALAYQPPQGGGVGGGNPFDGGNSFESGNNFDADNPFGADFPSDANRPSNGGNGGNSDGNDDGNDKIFEDFDL